MRVLTTDRTLFDRNREPVKICADLISVFLENGLVTVLSEDVSATRNAIIANPRLVDCLVTSTEDYQQEIAAYRAQRAFDMLVEIDPSLITWAYSQGIPAMLVLEPKFLDPKFRPDGPGIVPWAQLVDEVESQQRILAEKRSRWHKDDNARFE